MLKVYNRYLLTSAISQEQKKILQYQLKGLLNCFLKLNVTTNF
jgi:hypothetical protein